MRIIALMNQKGGVGKTTTTANLGAALAEQGKRVCLIDLDPQAHLTINYGHEPNADVTNLYDVLVEDKSFLEAVQKIDKNIALVPSSIDLAGAEIELVTVIGRETLLKRKIEDTQHDFDFFLLDCPPSLGLLTINALSVAHEVIIPMQPHFLALQGVAKLLETVRLVNQRMNPHLKVTGVVLTMFDAQTKLSNEVVAELNNFIEQAQGKPLPWAGAKVFNTKIRRNIKLAECPSFGQTIMKYDATSNGAFDYRNLARELLGLAPIVPKPAPARTQLPADAKPTPMKTEVPAVATPAPVKATVATEPKSAPVKAPVPPEANPAPAKAPPAPKPVAAKAPAAVEPKRAPVKSPAATAPKPPGVSVKVNPEIDSAKLAASSVPPAPAKHQEVA